VIEVAEALAITIVVEGVVVMEDARDRAGLWCGTEGLDFGDIAAMKGDFSECTITTG